MFDCVKFKLILLLSIGGVFLMGVDGLSWGFLFNNCFLVEGLVRFEKWFLDGEDDCKVRGLGCGFVMVVKFFLVGEVGCDFIGLGKIVVWFC